MDAPRPDIDPVQHPKFSPTIECREVEGPPIDGARREAEPKAGGDEGRKRGSVWARNPRGRRKG